MALVPKKPVALSVGSINVDHRVVRNPLAEDKTKISTYEIHEGVSLCEQVESNDVSYKIDVDTQGNKSSEVSARKQSQTSSTVYDIEIRRSSEDLNNIVKGATIVRSKGSDKIASDNKTYVVNLYDGRTKLQKDVLVDGTGLKGSGTVTVRLYTTMIRRPCGLEKKVKGIQLVKKHCSGEQQNNKDCLLSEGKMLSQ